MNIGIVTVWFERGAAYVSRAYEETLSSGGHKVFIYARGGERFADCDPGYDRSNVTWSRPIANMPSDFVSWNDFKDWVKRFKLDAVIFNEQHEWSIILKARNLNILLGAYIDYYTPETVPFYWLYDFLLCNTKRHYSVFKSHPQAIFIPWGTNTEIYKPIRCAPVNPGYLTFFHSCGLSAWRKGTDLLIDAFQRVQGPAKLFIHAQQDLAKCFIWTDGNEAKQTIDKISKDKRICLIEREVGAPGLYELGDVYVYPTRLEGIGLTIAEALSAGLPVITTNDAPMNEFVLDGCSGQLVNVGKKLKRFDGYFWDMSVCDVDALAKAMQHYVDIRHDIPALTKKTRDYALRNLNWQANSKILSDKISRLEIHREYASNSILEDANRFSRKFSRFSWLSVQTEYKIRKTGLDRMFRDLKAFVLKLYRK